MFAMTDNTGFWFADGVEVLSITNLHTLYMVDLDPQTRVISGWITNNGGGAYALLSLTNGINTDESWKCINEQDLQPYVEGAKI